MIKKYFIKVMYVVLAVCMLVGCSSKQAEMAPMEEAKSESMKEEAKYDTVENVSGTEGSSDGIQINTSINMNRKIIKTGNLEIETKAFDQTIQDIMGRTELLGGFMQNCNIQGNTLQKPSSLRSANLTIRIPNKQFDKFMNDTDRYGNVVTKSIEGQDVTDQYMDTEIRLNSLEIQAERLKELLKQAGKLQDLFTIEQELARVTYEIESLKGTLKKYDSLIDYATVNVFVTETKEYQEQVEIPVTFGEKIATQFKTSFKAVVNLMKGCVLIIVALVPFFIVIIPVGLLLIVLTKKIKKWKSKPIDYKHKEQEDQKDEE